MPVPDARGSSLEVAATRSTHAALLVSMRGKRRHGVIVDLISGSLMEGFLASDDLLVEIGNGSQAKALVLGAAQDGEQVLGVDNLLGDDRVGLAVGAGAEHARVDAHHVDDAEQEAGRRVAAVEAELADVEADQVELRLEIVAESDHLGTALAGPAVGDALELVGVETAGVELRRDVVVQSTSQNELKLAEEETLLAGIEGDNQTALLADISLVAAGHARSRHGTAALLGL